MQLIALGLVGAAMAQTTTAAPEAAATGMCFLKNRKTTTTTTTTTTQPPKPTSTPKPTPTPTPKPQTQPQAGYDGACLEAHNSMRRKLGLKQLSWDSNLANKALSNSWYLHSKGYIFHTSTGENLAQGVRSCSEGVNLFVAERPYYKGYKIGDGPFEQYGHYTQVIWPEASRVGCGFVQDGGFLTCRYDIGNIEGVALQRY
ncbi:CAP domain-containing protein [Gorgonomyces haynaldii]|nr:CAP domain-containing protein [Gorgonomyces haynaldii]